MSVKIDASESAAEVKHIVRQGGFFANGRSPRQSMQILWAVAIELKASVAIWRLPYSKNFHLLIDFSTACKEGSLDIQNGAEGFAISPFVNQGGRKTVLLRPQFHATFEKDTANILSANGVPPAFLDALEREVNQLRTNLEMHPGKQPDADPGADKAHFLNMVNSALKLIAHNVLEKVVIARTLQMSLTGKLDLLGLLQRLGDKQPNALVSLISLPGLGTWMGASPELLAGLNGKGRFRTVSLAGTRAYSTNAPLLETLWNQKELEEQAMVSRFIVTQFKALRLHEFRETGPCSVRAGPVIHLKTEYQVDMQATRQPDLGNRMLRLLHPTSAICGIPKQAARDFILSHEGFDRGLYAGFLGPVNIGGETQLYVNLRCMQVLPLQLTLYAGAGITRDSVAENEWRETDLKCQTLWNLVAAYQAGNGTSVPQKSGNPGDAIKNTQHLYDLVELCACKGVRYAVLCPGSRCAPLLIGFGKHAQIETLSVTDERSAGFIGLGLAQQTDSPVVLVCTSGTAGQNFAPAVTEAFYQNVPLIVLTADRPPEWIDQWDSQTIHQQALYGDHLRAHLDFQAGEDALSQAEAILDQAILPVAGPIHLNIPIHKPFYPQTLDEVHFPVLDAVPPSRPATEIPDKYWAALDEILQTAEKLLIVAGQQRLNEKLLSMIARLKIPLLGDITSNIHPNAQAIQSADILDDSLQPDFLITIGRSVISEHLKQHFRRHKPVNHWHIGRGMVGNPFQSLSRTVPADPCDFFQAWLERNLRPQKQNAWQEQLNQRARQLHSHLSNCLQCDSLNQFAAIKMIINALPECKNALHLGNSMPVRIANMIGLERPEVAVWSNRGTSGIDGTLSTAVGHALAQPDRLHTLIIGDLAFFFMAIFWGVPVEPDVCKSTVSEG
ncbi:2-succinyl-5-enolpyruvyl-6-hydroxy-3-cyclohexene-1-carboxylic-acid synthase [hydrothermal vent metagenome]|uniref:2-succinyl-5-enolpyruvyl-6-hydroxy-3-cyclohexene-1-carboxylic-acid synthase n=1 Tax=hydrothermal vent metagenome TaxID=652676 RepID=A0A3B1AZN3_9ZZZZ